MTKTAVVAGHICLDIIPSVDHHFDLVPALLLSLCSAAASKNLREAPFPSARLERQYMSL